MYYEVLINELFKYTSVVVFERIRRSWVGKVYKSILK